MRRHALALVALLVLAGCTTLGEVATPRPGASLPSAPPLPAAVALEGGEVVARDGTSATLVWRGVIEGVTIADPLFGGPVVDLAERSTTLSLPPGLMHVGARLFWNGSANLDLFLDGPAGDLCRGDRGEGGILEPVEGRESCAAWANTTGGEDWTIYVTPLERTQDSVEFEVVVAVTSLPAWPLYDVAAGPAGSVGVADASVPGDARVVVAEYDFGAMVVTDPVTKRPYPVRLLGVAHFPEEGERLPLVVLLHGRHGSCEGLPGAVSHCRAPDPAGRSIASHRGYDDVAQILASHGYAVVSIDANDINALDTPGVVPPGDTGMDARAQLILRTLDALRDVHAQGGAPANAPLDALRGRLDLERIGLMGHSRGAEGVTRAPGYAREVGHWSADAIRAVWSLAGTPRAHLPGYENPIVEGPAYAAVIPYCDGDVWMLGNADFYDLFRGLPARGPLAQLLFMGANHDFYNSQWPQDDAGFWWQGDPACAPVDAERPGHGRLSAEDQARHQRVYLPAFFRWRLGGESAFAPLFTGEAAPPPSACPERVASCPGLVHVSWQPLPGDMLSIEDAAADDALATNDLGGPTSFEGASDVAWCDPLGGEAHAACQLPRAIGYAPRLVVSWNGSATWRTEIPDHARDAAVYDTLAFRVGLDFAEVAAPGGVAPRVTIVLEDERGRRAEVDAAEHSAALYPPPGGNARRIALNQVRVPLDAFDEVDLERVAAVELRFDGGTAPAAHVADLALLTLSPRA